VSVIKLFSKILPSLSLALSFALLLANCSLDISVEDISSSGDDFLKSSVLSQTEGISDGLTDLLLTLELRNSDDTLVAGYTPSFEIINGSGATFVGCSVSNENGISVCRFRATISGTKTVAVLDLPIEITEEIVFKAPERSGTFMQIVSSAQNNVDAGGYKVTSHIGAPVQGLRQKVDGYEIFTSTTGAITPTEE